MSAYEQLGPVGGAPPPPPPLLPPPAQEPPPPPPPALDPFFAPPADMKQSQTKGEQAQTGQRTAAAGGSGKTPTDQSGSSSRPIKLDPVQSVVLGVSILFVAVFIAALVFFKFFDNY